jgi:SAM-dependent methyltransferase
VTAAAESELLHRGGAASAWRNLGLWPALPGDRDDYAAACRTLADRVAEAAGLVDGEHVLSLGCGRGEELLHWVRRHGAAATVGIEQDAGCAHAAHALAAEAGLAPGRITVLAQSAPPLHSRYAPERFDVVLSVDAAYLLSPRVDWLLAAHASLRPGGRLAYTDLALRGARPARWVLRRLASACGIDGTDLVDEAEQTARLEDIGFEAVQAERLDDGVLGGFAGYVQRQGTRLGEDARSPAWRPVARTAQMIRLARPWGLGYTLLSARKPG